MVSFEPLAIDEANAFLDESIREFVSERVPADHADIAVEKIREELSQRLLPNGTLTNGHRFEAIISNGDGVGRVWFGQCRTTNQTCTSATSASPRSADVKVMLESSSNGSSTMPDRVTSHESASPSPKPVPTPSISTNHSDSSPPDATTPTANCGLWSARCSRSRPLQKPGVCGVTLGLQSVARPVADRSGVFAPLSSTCARQLVMPGGTS